MRWSTGQEITFQFIRSSREPFRNIPWVMSLTWLFACVCACVPDGGWAEKQQLPTDSFLHQTGIRQGNPCQVRECVGVVGGFVGPSGELAPGPEGCVGSLVSMCIQNRSYSIRKSGKSCRCWLSLSRSGCRPQIWWFCCFFPADQSGLTTTSVGQNYCFDWQLLQPIRACVLTAVRPLVELSPWLVHVIVGVNTTQLF